MRSMFLAAAMILPAAAQAQTPAADFPADAKPIAADALKERLAGKVFRVSVANGNVWRLQFQGSGNYFLDIRPSNYNDSGKWRAEDSALCFEPQKAKPGCNALRLAGDLLYFKRDNGEVVKLEPQ